MLDVWSLHTSFYIKVCSFIDFCRFFLKKISTLSYKPLFFVYFSHLLLFFTAASSSLLCLPSAFHVRFLKNSPFFSNFFFFFLAVTILFLFDFFQRLWNLKFAGSNINGTCIINEKKYVTTCVIMHWVFKRCRNVFLTNGLKNTMLYISF